MCDGLIYLRQNEAETTGEIQETTCSAQSQLEAKINTENSILALYGVDTCDDGNPKVFPCSFRTGLCSSDWTETGELGDGRMISEILSRKENWCCSEKPKLSSILRGKLGEWYLSDAFMDVWDSWMYGIHGCIG